MKAFRIVLVVLAAFAAALAPADGPEAGRYLFTTGDQVGVITLTPAAHGQFTVGGGGPKGFKFSGTMRADKTGIFQLKAKYRIPGSDNEGHTFDGYWDSAKNQLVITLVDGKELKGYAAKRTSNFQGSWIAGRNTMTLDIKGDQVTGSTTYLDGHIEGTVKGDELQFTLSLSNGWVSKFYVKIEGGPNHISGYAIGVEPKERSGLKESTSWDRTGY